MTVWSGGLTDFVVVHTPTLLPITAGASLTFSPLTVSATGRLEIHGTLSRTFGALTLTATGVGEPPISGVLNVTLGALTLTATGTLTPHAIADDVLRLTLLSGVPTLAVLDAAIREVLVETSPAEITSDDVIRLTLQIDLPDEGHTDEVIRLVLMAAVPAPAVLDVTFDPLTLIATGLHVNRGAVLDGVLGPLTLTSTGITPNRGQLHATFDPLRLVALATLTHRPKHALTNVAVLELPFTARPQVVRARLGDFDFSFRLAWNIWADCWVIDIAIGDTDVPLISGIPLITGADLLAQFEYIGMNGEILVISDQKPPDVVPDFTDLGHLPPATGHTYFLPFANPSLTPTPSPIEATAPAPPDKITVFELPFTARQQVVRVRLAGTEYVIRLAWNIWADCWVIDIADSGGNPLINGVPLVTGADLLAQFGYIGIDGQLLVISDQKPPDVVPDFTDLGTTGHTYFLPN